MTEPSKKSPSLPPRWFICSFWAVQRAVYSVTGGRFGLRAERRPPGDDVPADCRAPLGGARKVILGYFEEGPDLVTMAMNGWGDPEPAWRLNLQAHPDATVDLPGASRAVHARAANPDEPAAPVGSMGHLRQGSRRLRRAPLTGDRGRHPLAPTISTSSSPNASGRPLAAASNVGSIIALRVPSTLILAKRVSARALRSSGPTAAHHSGRCSRYRRISAGGIGSAGTLTLAARSSSSSLAMSASSAAMSRSCTNLAAARSRSWAIRARASGSGPGPRIEW